jgi:hypothetical protein
VAPAPARLDVAKMTATVMHKMHLEPLMGMLVTDQAVVTACAGGAVKLWLRPAVWNRLMEQAASGKQNVEA